jgi:hypothetical protein
MECNANKRDERVPVVIAVTVHISFKGFRVRCVIKSILHSLLVGLDQ